MRADRLISMLILLQLRGRLTAQELAEELEVSTRTVYRDLHALDAAGVPVFTEPGPGGGCGLEEAYRTSLTGLTTEEVQALFMLSIPNALHQLGVGSELKAAFLKLAASLPAASRREEDRTRQRIHIDATAWFHSDHPVPCLRRLHQAIWRDELVQIRLRLPFSAEAELEVAPYGLVAKADTWHLVSQQLGRWRVDPAADILEVTHTGRQFQRAENFSLTEFWEAYCHAIEADRTALHVHLRVKPELLEYYPQFLGDAPHSGAQNYPVDADGWFLLDINFENLAAARRQLLAYGGAVEVLAPRQLRLSLQDFAAQIINLYGPAQSNS
jgi:predicted DNA-binding transcriptional regulator YafY